MKVNAGHYVLVKRIAVGGMAEIFLALRRGMGEFSRFVVIKRLLPEHRERPVYERLFVAEGRLTARLHHPHVVDLHDFGKLDGAYFMAMEYLHGVSAAELIGAAAKVGRRIPLGVSLYIVRAIAEALHYSHFETGFHGQRLGVIHHDVSPHNVQLTYDGRVKLLDFGVATSEGDKPKGQRGKYAYMSPEVLEKHEIDHRSDLFSLGVILYEITMGRRLFKRKKKKETLRCIQALEIPPPRSLKPKYPADLEAVLLKSLSRAPADRFQTGREFSEALSQVIHHHHLKAHAENAAAFMRALFGEAHIQGRMEELKVLAARKIDEPLALPDPIPKGEGDALFERTPTQALPDPEDSPTGPALEREPLMLSPLTSLPMTPDSGEHELDISGPTGTFKHANQDLLFPAEGLEASLLPEMQIAALTAPSAGRGRRPWAAALLLIAGLILGGLAGRALSPAPPAPSKVLLESEPEGARVYRGEQLLGMTPFELAVTEADTSALRFTAEGFNEGRLAFSSAPPPARVWIQLTPAP